MLMPAGPCFSQCRDPGKPSMDTVILAVGWTAPSTSLPDAGHCRVKA